MDYVRSWRVAALLAACWCAGCAPAPRKLSAELGAPATKADEALLGAEFFRSYCVNCHGDSGTGDGQLAKLLKIATPDLTRLASANGGVFPRAYVRERIDGTSEVEAHGSRTMPVWGVVLDPSRGTGGEQDRMIAQRQIDSLLRYVESIQAGEYR
jgi:hypothetical protein